MVQGKNAVGIYGGLREEEVLMRGILDRIKLIGDGPQSLYYIDKEVRAINNQAIEEDAAAEK